MPKIMRLFILGLAFLGLAACETAGVVRHSSKPQTFTQGLAQIQGQIGYLRDMTAFFLDIRGEDCVKSPNTDLCAAAAKIDVKTREYRDKVDLMYHAYEASSGVLSQCKIVYNNVVLPCETTEDQILAGLIELQALLPKGEK